MQILLLWLVGIYSFQNTNVTGDVDLLYQWRKLEQFRMLVPYVLSCLLVVEGRLAIKSVFIVNFDYCVLLFWLKTWFVCVLGLYLTPVDSS